jgi:hypothetical protein
MVTDLLLAKELVYCGSIVQIKLKPDRNRSGLNFSYVTFDTTQSAINAVHFINSDQFLRDWKTPRRPQVE